MTSRQTRAAQVGDLCVLLVPTHSQSPVIRTQLADLQRQFGGEIVAPLHVTCQRFSATDEQLEALKPHLSALCERSAPIHVVGKRLEPFYSTFRAQEILKCHLAANSNLTKFISDVKASMSAAGIGAHYEASDSPITLLEGVKINRLNVFEFRRKLFIGQRLLLTRIKSPGHYSTLFSAAFADVLEPELQVSDLL